MNPHPQSSQFLKEERYGFGPPIEEFEAPMALPPIIVAAPKKQSSLTVNKISAVLLLAGILIGYGVAQLLVSVDNEPYPNDAPYASASSMDFRTSSVTYGTDDNLLGVNLDWAQEPIEWDNLTWSIYNLDNDALYFCSYSHDIDNGDCTVFTNDMPRWTTEDSLVLIQENGQSICWTDCTLGVIIIDDQLREIVGMRVVGVHG